MQYYNQFLEIAETGDIETIKSAIDRFEFQENQVGLTDEGEKILTMLKNSLEWYRPESMFNRMKFFNPNEN